ncbi:hypothetical protein ACFVYA_39285 [Amycolatopsis sp. NPDC058278]|uniref:hypothetical protein n=1 Tax=Amycolatopsis sp. NPDC058278 TaxID=3346417 RepID=UPI0036D9CBB1
MTTRRRTAAVLAAALLGAAAVVTTAPPAVALTTSYPPAGGYEVVTVVRWAFIRVVDADFHQRLKVVRLTRAFEVRRPAVTDTTPVRPQLTPAAPPPQDRTAVFVPVFEQ